MEHEHRTKAYTLEHHDILNSATALASSLQGKREGPHAFPLPVTFLYHLGRMLTVFSLICQFIRAVILAVVQEHNTVLPPTIVELCLLRSDVARQININTPSVQKKTKHTNKKKRQNTFRRINNHSSTSSIWFKAQKNLLYQVNYQV